MKRLSLTQNFLTKYQNHSIVSNLLDFLPVHRLIKICKPNKFLTNKFLKEKIKISGYNNLANIYIFYNLKDFYEYFQTIRYESLYEYQLIIIYLIKNNILENFEINYCYQIVENDPKFLEWFFYYLWIFKNSSKKIINIIRFIRLTLEKPIKIKKSNLKHLILSDEIYINKIENLSIEIFKILKFNSIRKIVLNNSKIINENNLILKLLISKCKYLKSLEFINCQIHTNILISLIRTDCNLKTLSFIDNEFLFYQKEKILNFFKKICNNKLQNFIFKNNYCKNDDFLYNIITLFYNSELNILYKNHDNNLINLNALSFDNMEKYLQIFILTNRFLKIGLNYNEIYMIKGYYFILKLNSFSNKMILPSNLYYNKLVFNPSPFLSDDLDSLTKLFNHILKNLNTKYIENLDITDLKDLKITKNQVPNKILTNKLNFLTFKDSSFLFDRVNIIKEIVENFRGLKKLFFENIQFKSKYQHFTFSNLVEVIFGNIDRKNKLSKVIFKNCSIIEDSNNPNSNIFYINNVESEMINENVRTFILYKLIILIFIIIKKFFKLKIFFGKFKIINKIK